ncbi:MAG: ParA family protein [Anaerolineales bacterium]|nr:MAG: ParA family protein [Anaerolineales bacterium]
MTRIYALVNQKGGVGKTTTAINLGANIAKFGMRVLLVDIDPQANATSCLGINHSEIRQGTYDAFIGRVPASEIVLHNQKLKLSLLPSSSALVGAQIEMIDVPERERVLKKMLQPLSKNFDYIFVDCPPSLGLLTLNGLLAASNGVIIPIQCEYLALEGLTQLMETLTRVKSGLFPELSIRGMLLTMYDGRTNLSQDVVKEVRQHFPDEVFQTVIPRSVRLAEAPSHGLPITAYSPNSSGAVAYLSLAQEFLQGDGIENVETNRNDEVRDE